MASPLYKNDTSFHLAAQKLTIAGDVVLSLLRMSPPKAPNLWLAKALWDLGAIQFGDFSLGRTTLHSPIYINLRLLVSKPRALRRAASLMHHEVRTLQSMRHAHVAPFDRVAGIPFGGLHLATAFSLMSNLPI